MGEFGREQGGRVFLGDWVEIENDDGDTKILRIVGPDEIYDRKDYISIDSPMARALLKKEEDDQVEVKTPEGIRVWYINRISYADDNQEG